MLIRHTVIIILSLFLCACLTQAKVSSSITHGIIRVVDGDTLVIAAPYLPPELGDTLLLRIYGIDTPERGHQAKCNAEREKSRLATEFVRLTLVQAKEVKIELKKWDKYGGRVLGDAILDGKKLSEILIDNGMAVSYLGGRKDKNWC